MWLQLAFPQLPAGFPREQPLPHPIRMTNSKGQSLLHAMALSGDSEGMVALRYIVHGASLTAPGRADEWRHALRQQDLVSRGRGLY
jgi:hypothetical protein